MHKPKVSIVIPVYNSEKYLSECLESLINQTLKEVEIICVDDGSTDNSPQVLDEYAKKDSRIKVFHKKNEGVSVARNFGIRKVQGEYLTFVDSDDWLELNSLEILYETAKKRNSDLLLFSFYSYFPNKLEKNNRLVPLKNIIEDGNTTFLESYKYIFDSPMGILSKFYKTALLKDNNIFYPENIQCSEDRPFYIQACINAKSISVLDEPFYYYRRVVSNSLTQGNENSVSDSYKANQMIKQMFSNFEDRKKMFCSFLREYISNLLWACWISELKSDRANNTKYLQLLKKECKEFKNYPDFPKEKYNELISRIKDYNNLYKSKLIEPVLEIEHRTDRIVIYLFEKQIFNLYTGDIKSALFSFKYILRLLRLRFVAKIRKIKVALFVTDISKWTCQSLYDEFKNSKHFEPIVYLTLFKDDTAKIDYIRILKEGIEYFKNRNIKIEILYDIDSNKFLPIKDYKTDIVFYQQPWGYDIRQKIDEAAKFALLCYIPYCFYSMDSKYSYMEWFHGKLWKYFVETPFHKQEYEKKYNGYNCEALGSVKLDNYKSINLEKVAEMRKSGKKRVIYAPHHSVAKHTDHAMATFAENGVFILELAKKHPEIEWIFRPHPVFVDSIIRYDIMTREEIEQYYEEWEKIGTISTSADNYYEQFMSSDCLITDCISFLAEYLPTNKPVIHLRRKEQLFPFNDLLKNVIEGYYQIHNNEELEKTFNEVIINGNDYLKDVRAEKVKYLMIDENKTAAQKIREYLEKKLRIK